MQHRWIYSAAMAFALIGGANAARAEMFLSKVVVDFADAAQAFDDIDIFHSGEERLYVVVEPAEIHLAGTAQEERTPIANPAEAALFVSPKRLVLEPGERRVVRISAFGSTPENDWMWAKSLLT